MHQIWALTRACRMIGAPLAFNVQWRGRQVLVRIDRSQNTIEATLTFGEPMAITIGGKQHRLAKEALLSVLFTGKCNGASVD